MDQEDKGLGERTLHFLTGQWYENAAEAFPGSPGSYVEEKLAGDDSEPSGTWSQPGLPKETRKRQGYHEEEKVQNLVLTYFRSLGNISLLNREEEERLAITIDEGKAIIEQIFSMIPFFRKDGERTMVDNHCAKRGPAAQGKYQGLSGMLRTLDALIAQKGKDETWAVLGLEKEDFGKKMETLSRARESVETARKELICRNLRLAISVAKHYVGRGLPLLDLIQEGNIGLMNAIDKFDYRKGFRFDTYATWWIRQSISIALLEQSKTVRIPAKVMEVYRKASRTARELTIELGAEPGIEEISQRTGISRQTIEDAFRAVLHPIALQTPVGENGTTIQDIIPDQEGSSLLSEMDRNELAGQVLNVLNTLAEREGIVIRMRYGIGTDRTYTLSEIGRRLSITSERVRQIELNTMRKLRHPRRLKLLKTL